MIDLTRIHTHVLSVITLLVRGEYVALANLTGNSRLTAEEIERAVTEYGRTVCLPPSGNVPPDLDIIPREGNPDRVFLVMSLWTIEEGESDLSLEMTLIRLPQDVIDVQIDGIHVL